MYFILIAIVITIIGSILYKKGFSQKAILSSQSGRPDSTIVFIGDSMTEYLGNFDELRRYLKKYYPGKNFLLLNYGFSATNILSVKERIEKESTHSGRIFKPVNDIPFDLVIIESFGHNPLSDYPLEEGLRLQEKALLEIAASLRVKQAKAKIIFMATIAPHKERYAEGVINLSTQERRKWAEEREAYIKNHIAYARKHNIPLINVYEVSLDEKGSGNIEYINTKDFIHPSPTGIYFISEKIAEFLYKNKYL